MRVYDHSHVHSHGITICVVSNWVATSKVNGESKIASHCHVMSCLITAGDLFNKPSGSEFKSPLWSRDVLLSNRGA